MKKRKDMSDTEKVQTLQRKLYLLAKQEPKYRFYSLYDKLTSGYVLREAWLGVKANDGGAGVDGKTIDQIEKEGVAALLEQIAQELQEGSYKPQSVKRKMINKGNGKLRPLGIPTVKDRIVQGACKLIIEPIFEAEFQDSSHGFRPKRNAAGAMQQIKEGLREGRHEVLDADLSSYFDTIPHDKLVILLKQRISDMRVIKLITMWLKSPVQEEDGRTTGGRSSTKGTPQGGVISPLLANIYLNLIDRIVKDEKNLFSKAGIRIIRYADDFVMMGRRISEEAMGYLKHLLTRMELRMNEQKTRRINAREESFQFLGFQIRYDQSMHDKNGKFWNIAPSPKSISKLKEKIRTARGRYVICPGEVIARKLNSIIKGWLNYYTIPGVSYTKVARNDIDYYLRESIWRLYQRKSQRQSPLYCQNAYQRLRQFYGLVDVRHYGLKAVPANANKRRL
jgi:RNA-directed DNA polymerase